MSMQDKLKEDVEIFDDTAGHDDISLDEVVKEDNADITDESFDFQDGRSAEDEVTEDPEYSESLDAAISYENAGEVVLETDDTDREEVEDNSDINDDLFNFYDEFTSDATELSEIAETEESSTELPVESETEYPSQEAVDETETPDAMETQEQEEIPLQEGEAIESDSPEIEEVEPTEEHSEFPTEFESEDNVEFTDNDVSTPQFEIEEPSIMDEFCDYVANDEPDPTSIIDTLDDYFDTPDIPEYNTDIPEIPESLDFEDPIQDVDKLIECDFRDDIDYNVDGDDSIEFFE